MALQPATIGSPYTVVIALLLLFGWHWLGADLGGNLGVHDAAHQDPQGLPQQVHVSVHTALA